MSLAIALALVMASCVVVWQLARTPAGFLIVPGATDVDVQSRGWSEQEITYTWNGAPYGWYFAIIRSLSAGGWATPVDNRIGLRVRSETHWRLLQFGFIYLSEEIALRGEPNAAHIRVRRQLIIPWRRIFS